MASSEKEEIFSFASPLTTLPTDSILLKLSDIG